MTRTTPLRLALYLAGATLALLSAVIINGNASTPVARADTASSTPMISAIASSTTDTGATLSWTTDMATNAQVRYGTTTSYGTFSALNSAFSTSHSQILSALLPGTLYHFQIQSSNASGTMATSSDQTFMTTGSTPSTGTSTPTTGSSTMMVMLMTHLCNSSIHTLTDFENLGNGKGPVATLAADVLACPTTGLPANAAVANTVASPRSTYDFSVQSGTTTQLMSANGTFMPHKLCESDVNLDVNNDGTIASSTCLDISHYELSMASSSGNTVVMETVRPTGYHFGTLRFTPPALDGNNDSQSLVSLDSSNGTITLHPQTDADGMIMLHVYQFLDSTTTPSGGGTTTASTTQELQNQITHLQNQLNALEQQFNSLQQQFNALSSGGTGGSSGGGTGTTTGNTGGNATANPISSISPGGTIDLGGHNFAPNESVQITLGGSLVATGHADGGGNFTTGSLRGPTATGTYTYTFTGMQSGMVRTATLTVTP